MLALIFLEATTELQGADFHPASLCTLRILIQSEFCITEWLKPLGCVKLLGCVDEIYDGLESTWFWGKS